MPLIACCLAQIMSSAPGNAGRSLSFGQQESSAAIQPSAPPEGEAPPPYSTVEPALKTWYVSEKALEGHRSGQLACRKFKRLKKVVF